MAKDTKDKVTFFSPKKGELCDYKPTSKTRLVEAVDILSKLKTEVIHITKDSMFCINDEHTLAITVLFKLGVEGCVDRKEFKNIIKLVPEEFSTSLSNEGLEFHWDGNSTKIPIVNEDYTVDWNLGEEEAEYKGNKFFTSLFLGGCAVSTDFDNRLGQIAFDYETIASSDNVMLCEQVYKGEEQDCLTIFALSGKAFELWRNINLPSKYLAVYENGNRFMIRDDIIIWDKSKYNDNAKVNNAIKAKVDAFIHEHKKRFKFPEETWKALKMFKGCKELIIKNNEIKVSGNVSLKKSTNIVPFDNDREEFVVNTKQLFRLENLTTSNSDFSVVTIQDGPYYKKYLYVDPDPGLKETTIILAGICEEMKYNDN